MRTLEALKDLAKKLTGKSTIPGDTVDEVIDYAASNFEIAEADSANGLVLTSPDESVWDIKIANDGTISGTKRS